MTDELNDWYVYSYSFLDDLTFIRKPAKVNKDWQKNSPFSGIENLDQTIETVKQRFLQEGWEGDGEIGLIWLPPFVDIGSDNFGTYIWHVKQQNNGVSWLLSPEKLNFKRIEKQNPWDKQFAKKGWLPTNIISMDVEPFRLELLENKNRLAKQIDFINHGMDEQTEKEIIADLLKHHQGQIIADFYNFLDWCYLRLLQEVILDGNHHKIKIQKSSVSLSFIDDYPTDDAETGNSPFFTLSGLLTDMWTAYKFEPINKKFDMLFKSVDFSLPKNLRDLIINQWC